MIKLYKYFERKKLILVFLLIVLIVAQVWLDLRIPEYMSAITAMIETSKPETMAILREGAFMLLCAAGSAVMAVLTGLVTSNIAASFSKTLRHEIFHKVQSFSKEEMDRFSTASLITRSTNDVVQLQNFTARGLRQLIQAPIMATLAIMKISGRYWQWTAVTAGGVLIVVFCVVIVTVFAHPRFRRMQSLTDELNRVTRENLTGIRVIKAYNGEPYEKEKFREANDRLADNALRARSVMQIMGPATRFVNNTLTIAIYCISAFLIVQSSAAEQLSIFTDMVVFSTYASKLIQVFMSMNMIINMLPRAMTSAQRIAEVLDTESTIKSGKKTMEKDAAGAVEFVNVSFTYPDSTEMALDQVSFKAHRGETIGIIGSTASGKTTLVNLIPRFFDPAEGSVLINGIDAREYDLQELRNKLSYVPQQAVLLTGTIYSNVIFGDNGKPNPTYQDVQTALDAAQATEFVQKMENGLDAKVNRGGSNVSGGQKQRLSIARAVAREPEIYIFDDAFSALDYKTDRQLRSALKNASGDATVILVASRIATIRDADQIIVMDEGKIVGRGSHAELLKSCQVYREIAHTQLSEEELSNG